MFRVQAMFRYGTIVSKTFKTRNAAMSTFIGYAYSKHVAWCEIHNEQGFILLSSYRDEVLPGRGIHEGL